MTTSTGRIETIDVIRGFAVLGILKINLSVGLPTAAAYFPAVAGGVTGWNLAVLGFDTLFAEGRMRALFCMLFGAALLITSSRATGDRPSGEFVDHWFHRNLWLMVFGTVHAYVLLWNYDILFYYGLAGIFVYGFRNLTPKAVLWISLLWIVVSAGAWAFQWQQMHEIARKGKQAAALDAKDVELNKAERDALSAYRDQEDTIHPRADDIADEIAKRRGGYLSNFAWNAKVVFSSHHIVPYGLFSFEVLVTMLMGMALFRTGVLSGERSTAFYAKLAAACYAIALPAQAAIFRLSVREGFDPMGVWSSLASGMVYQPLRYLVALGHLSVLVLLVRGGYLRWLTSRLMAAGRMALTNYVLQSVMCAFVFCGFGLGLFAKLDRVGLFGVCLLIWAFELLVSPLWMARFRMGPVEWLWRSLTRWKREPLLLKAPDRSVTPVSPATA